MSAATLHSSPSLFLSQGVGVTLQPGQARTLRVPAAGQLRVTQGALWVTRRGRHPSHAPDDLYVAADAPLALCAGETVVIERTGYPTATVRRALSSLFRPRYRVDSAGGDLEVVGDIIGREYAIRRGGMEAARISRGPVSVRECYGVEVAPGEDAVLMLSVAVALQAFRTGAQAPPVTRAGPDLSR